MFDISISYTVACGMWTLDRLRSGDNMLSPERQLPALSEPDGSKNVLKLAGQAGDDGDSLSEPAAAGAGASHADSTLDPDTWVQAAEFVHPDSMLDSDTWVKAAEFVPGQLWQSVGKYGILYRLSLWWRCLLELLAAVVYVNIHLFTLLTVMSSTSSNFRDTYCHNARLVRSIMVY